MIRSLLCASLLAAACGACSSNSDSSEMQASAGSHGDNGCPEMSGAWSIAAHCDPSLVGMSLQVTQSACQLSFAAPFDGFSGSVTPDGKIALSGPQTCTGTVTESAATMSCTPGTCAVKLTRVTR